MNVFGAISIRGGVIVWVILSPLMRRGASLQPEIKQESEEWWQPGKAPPWKTKKICLSIRETAFNCLLDLQRQFIQCSMISFLSGYVNSEYYCHLLDEIKLTIRLQGNIRRMSFWQQPKSESVLALLVNDTPNCILWGEGSENIHFGEKMCK